MQWLENTNFLVHILQCYILEVLASGHPKEGVEDDALNYG